MIFSKDQGMCSACLELAVEQTKRDLPQYFAPDGKFIGDYRSPTYIDDFNKIYKLRRAHLRNVACLKIDTDDGEVVLICDKCLTRFSEMK